MSLEALAHENCWLDKSKFEDAERLYAKKFLKNNTMEKPAKSCATSKPNAVCEVPGKNKLLAEIEKARQTLHEQFVIAEEYESTNSLEIDETSKEINSIIGTIIAFKNLDVRISALEGKSTKKPSLFLNSFKTGLFETFQSLLKQLEVRVTALENKKAASSPATSEQKDDDDVDLFGSESEDECEEAAKLKAQRIADYAARKSKKPTLIAKSNIILDVKPWDDETDMKELEKAVRQVATDGLLWGASKLVPLAYGIHKLQISCVVEDEKVSIDWLQETLQEIEDFVQSVDIAAFNKI